MLATPATPELSMAKALPFLALFALCAIAYIPGITGGFLFDDFSAIANNPALQNAARGKPDWIAVALMSDGGQHRPLSMLSFGLNAFVFGMDPLSFKLVNVAIHLVNGMLVFAVSRRIAAPLAYPNGVRQQSIHPDTLALLGTALWLLHPLHISTVLYVVQRMNELSSMFILTALFCYVDSRTRMLRGEQCLFQALAGLCVFGLIATASKENGVLTVGYAWIIETLCFRFEAPLRDRRTLKVFFWLTIASPILLFCLYLYAHPDMLGYSRNGFTLYTRMLSETRVLCDYLFWIFVPQPSVMGIYHDDIAVSQGLLDPISTAISIACWLALMAFAWRLRRRNPGFAFAVSWFLIGHSIESSIFGLELVFEHRNYLPMAGLLLGTVCALAQKFSANSFRRHEMIACLIVVASLTMATAVRAHDWRSPLAMALTDAIHHPKSSRAQYEAGRQIIIEGDRNNALNEARENAMPYFDRAAEAGPYELFPAVARVQIRAEHGTVLATELEDLASRLRSAQSNEQANAFLDFLVAASQTKLSLTPDDMSMLMEAALENARWPNKVRAMMLNNYGSYLFNVPRDYQGAISMTMMAAAAEPWNPYFQINLSKIALAVNNVAVARERLATAKELNKVGVYDQEIARIESQINSILSK